MDIEQVALANNPSLARASAHLEALRGAWLQSGLCPNPKVGVGQQQTGSHGLAEQDGVWFSQEIVLGGKLRLNRAVADKELTRAQNEFAVQKLRVLTDARSAFYHVLVAQRQQRLASELVVIAQRGVEAAKNRDNRTDIGENDVIEAQVELHRAEIVERKALNRHAAAWQSLRAIVGIRELPVQELDANLEQVREERNWPAELARVLGSSPEMSAAITQLELLEEALARATAERIPNVTVDGLMNWRNNGIRGEPDGGFLVSLPVPLWDHNQGSIMRGRGEVTAARQMVEQLEFDLQNRLAPIFERYANARYQVRHYRELILPASAAAALSALA